MRAFASSTPSRSVPRRPGKRRFRTSPRDSPSDLPGQAMPAPAEPLGWRLGPLVRDSRSAAEARRRQRRLRDRAPLTGTGARGVRPRRARARHATAALRRRGLRRARGPRHARGRGRGVRGRPGRRPLRAGGRRPSVHRLRVAERPRHLHPYGLVRAKCSELCTGEPASVQLRRCVDSSLGAGYPQPVFGRHTMAGRSRPAIIGLMEAVMVVARLLPDAGPQAQRMLANGPPFDPEERGFHRHRVFLTATEVIFLFEAPDVEWVVDDIVNDPVVSAAFAAWRPLLEEPPRLAHLRYAWERPAIPAR